MRHCKIGVAEDIVKSGLYETLQFPFSYLASDRDIALVTSCKEHDMGFIAMKGLSGGLLTDSKACMAFMSQFDALPIWGIQRQSELDEWLSYFDNDVSMTDEIRAFIDKDRNELLGEFCRGCGYCMPCTVVHCGHHDQPVREDEPDDKTCSVTELAYGSLAAGDAEDRFLRGMRALQDKVSL